MSDESIQPIIDHHKRKQSSGLERKQVSIAGTNDFSATIDKKVVNNIHVQYYQRQNSLVEVLYEVFYWL